MGKGLEFDALRVAVGGEEVVVLTAPALSSSRLPALTRAEREVVSRLLRGQSNTEIARVRRTSARTVANQVAAIFRKLRVRSRRELVALFR